MIKKILIITVAFLGLLACKANKNMATPQKKDSPRWVKERPKTTIYFDGIANCSVWEDNYMDIAKQRALADMASEIEVNIDVESIFNTTEEKGLVDESFSNTIKTKTAKALQGFEIGGSWEGKSKYWVYYRLSKNDYYDLLKRNMEAAIRVAESAIVKAENFEKTFDFYQAINTYLVSSKPLQVYLGETHFPKLSESINKLTNRAYTSITSILSKIEVKSFNEEKLELSTGEQSETELKAKFMIGVNGNLKPLSNFPVKYEFSTGDGVFNSNTVNTDSNGKSRGVLFSLSSGEANQIINVKPDVNALLKGYEGELIYYKPLLNFATNSDSYSIKLIKTTIFINSNEKNIGRTMSMPVIGPKLKEFFKSKGFEFASSKKESLYTINIISDTRAGSYTWAGNRKLTSSYLDMTVSIVDERTNKEIYTKSLNEVKGIKLDYKNAGLSAYKKAVKMLPKKIIPDLKDFFKIK